MRHEIAYFRQPSQTSRRRLSASLAAGRSIDCMGSVGLPRTAGSRIASEMYRNDRAHQLADCVVGRRQELTDRANPASARRRHYLGRSDCGWRSVRRQRDTAVLAPHHRSGLDGRFHLGLHCSSKQQQAEHSRRGRRRCGTRSERPPPTTLPTRRSVEDRRAEPLAKLGAECLVLCGHERADRVTGQLRLGKAMARAAGRQSLAAVRSAHHGGGLNGEVHDSTPGWVVGVGWLVGRLVGRLSSKDMTGGAGSRSGGSLRSPKSVYEGADIIVFSSCVVDDGSRDRSIDFAEPAPGRQDELRCGHWRGCPTVTGMTSLTSTVKR